MDILPSIIGAVTSEFLMDEANGNFLNFARFIKKPDKCITYINTVDNITILNILIEGEEAVGIPLELLYNKCPEFINYYKNASFEGTYNTDAITAFAIYVILKDYFDTEEDSEERASTSRLARIAAKFMKFGNLKLDKLLSDLRKSDDARLRDFKIKFTEDKSVNSGSTEK